MVSSDFDRAGRADVGAATGAMTLVVLVAALVVAAVAFPPAAEAQVAQGRVLVKFKPSLTQCAHCLLAQGQAFATALTDGSHDLDWCNQQVGASGGREMFFARHEMTTADAEQAFAAEIEVIRARFPERTRRIPDGAPPPDLGLVNVYQIDIAPDVNPLEACNLYNSDPHVEWCQPDHRMQTTGFVPNDPYYQTSGAFGQSYRDLWGVRQLNLERAWSTTQGDGVVVAVVDTGLDLFHPDIFANVHVNPLDPPNGLDDDGNGYVDDAFGWDFTDDDAFPIDDNGHGTHVAGTIAAVGDNAEGIVGVAPRAKIMPVKALDRDGSGFLSSLIEGMRYAARNGAQVINNSWGCTARCRSMPMVEDAVEYVTRAFGVTPVFSAGNSADDVFHYSPGNMTDGLTKPVVVAATDPSRRRAAFSNWGATIDVAGPGAGYAADANVPFEPVRGVLSLKASGCNPASACPPGLVVAERYLRQAGTSMAAPHVAAEAALVLACNDDMKTDQVRHVLQAAGRLRRGDGRIGSSVVDAYKALAYIDAPRVVLHSPTREQNLRQNQVVPVEATIEGASVVSWRLYVAAGSAPERRDYRLLARGSGPVDGVLHEWNLADQVPGLKTLKLEVRARVPLARAAGGVYACGEARLPGRYRTHYVREVQHVSVEETLPEEIVSRVTSDDTRRYFAPSVSGSRVAAEERPSVSEPGRIFVKDVATGSEQRIGAVGSGKPSLDPGDANRIVYLGPAGGRPEVFWHSFTLGASTQLTSFATGTRSDPRLSGSWVSYHDDQSGVRHLYLRNLGTGVTAQVTTGAAPVLWSHLAGDRLAWKQSGTMGARVRTLSTGAEETVFGDLALECFSLGGDWLVAFSNEGSLVFFPYGRILARNLVTGQEVVVAQGEASPQDGVFGCPAVDGDTVAYTRALGSSLFPFVHDLGTGVATRLTYAFDTVAADMRVSGDRVVWRDSREGVPYQIWMHQR